jgi:hypothetical protein
MPKDEKNLCCSRLAEAVFCVWARTLALPVARLDPFKWFLMVVFDTLSLGSIFTVWKHRHGDSTKSKNYS